MTLTARMAIWSQNNL